LTDAGDHAIDHPLREDRHEQVQQEGQRRQGERDRHPASIGRDEAKDASGRVHERPCR
jgi:hypothetical protein